MGNGSDCLLLNTGERLDLSNLACASIPSPNDETRPIPVMTTSFVIAYSIKLASTPSSIAASSTTTPSRARRVTRQSSRFWKSTAVGSSRRSASRFGRKRRRFSSSAPTMSFGPPSASTRCCAPIANVASEHASTRTDRVGAWRSAGLRSCTARSSSTSPLA